MLSAPECVRRYLCNWLMTYSFYMNAARELDTTQVRPYQLASSTSLNCHAVCLCLGATGPLYAGYMLAGGYSWRLFFYVEAAFAGALLVLAFLFVEESTYHRSPHDEPTSSAAEKVKITDFKKSIVQDPDMSTYVPPRKSFLGTLKPWSKVDHDARYFMTMIRPFSYFIIPAVLWVITTYGLSPPTFSMYLHRKHLTDTSAIRNLYRSWCFGI